MTKYLLSSSPINRLSKTVSRSFSFYYKDYFKMIYFGEYSGDQYELQINGTWPCKQVINQLMEDICFEIFTSIFEISGIFIDGLLVITDRSCMLF